ncbi:MAG: enoyl-CoA hydratase [Actinobacteria bacterium]|nr:MAG: enoyl-CoA hydratase [Actinomycetota bacterium]
MSEAGSIEKGPDGVYTFTLARPDAMNALNRELVELIAEASNAVRDDPDARATIFVGLGDRAFSAGADLKERAGLGSIEVAEAVASISRAIQAVAEIPVPTIAAINGAALGGGFELALACDIRIASTAAVMGLPETTLAIIPGGGGTQRLPRVAGEGRAKELIFTGRRISAADALQYGIVHEVAAPDELRMRALAVARTIASNGPIAVRAAKEAIVRGLEMPLNEGVTLENELYGRTVPTKDRLEGLVAFREKRAPVYRGE